MRPKPLTPAQRKLVNRLAPISRQPATYEPAIIESTRAGEAANGSRLVNVLWRGFVTPVPYLASYAPVTGDTVLLLIMGPQVLIMGRITGTPYSLPEDDPDPIS